MSHEDAPTTAEETPADDTLFNETLFDEAPADDAAAEAVATEKPAPTTETPLVKAPQRVRTWDRGPLAEPVAEAAPVAAAPAAEDQPVEETPVVQEPVVAVSEAEEPVVEEPEVAEPAEEPEAEVPADEPVAEEPAVEEAPVEDIPNVAAEPEADVPAATEAPDAEDEPAADEIDEEPAVEEKPTSGFAELGLKPGLLAALTRLGYEEPTPIQRQAIPELLNGRDLVGQAATGTGKTAAFALPILNGINKNDAAIPLALIVVPTRELAVQVSEAFSTYGRESNIKVLPVFGGQPIMGQLKVLKRGVHVVVGTPGRLIDHIKRRSLDLDAVQTVVLDEADEMLDMGFTEDIESILKATPDSRQTVLFSATMPPRIAKIAKTYQQDPITVQIVKSKGEDANPLIRQTVYMVLRAHKASALGRILDVETPTSAIVFCRTRHEVDELTVTMNGRGYRAEALHGGMDQKQRDRVMARLRDGTAELLVATDVAARGLDVDTLTHVVNYDVPAAAESYVHRIGRVGRAGREGVAITIAEPRQRRLLSNIERLTKQKFVFEKVPTVADLRTRQMDTTIAAVRDALAVQDLEDFRPVLDALGDEFSERDIALAAIKLAHRANAVEGDDREIPDASDWKQGKGKAGKDRNRGDSKGKGGKFDKGRKGKGYDGPKGFVYIDIGRKVGLRPGDVVGAIANEAGLSGSEIGPIKISEHYAVAGVPDNQVDSIVKAMQKAKIRGKQAKVRRYTD